MIDPEHFLRLLEKQFPGSLESVEDVNRGLLHVEVAAFRQTVELACTEARAWYVERAFRVVEQCLAEADPLLENALEISFIEDFALRGHKDAVHRIIKDRVSTEMRKRLIAVHEFWQ